MIQPLIVCHSCKKINPKFGEIDNSALCKNCYEELDKARKTISTNEFDFIVIDFEIANNKMSSACSLGIVFVTNNKIVDEKYFLIQPPTLEFDEATTKIHGLTSGDVVGAKKFDGIWEEIKCHFNNTPIIAHNAQFDMSVLHSCLKEYSLDLPEFEYLCSIPLSTKAISDQGVGNSLPERLAYFNIELTNHHNAIADARACAELVLACLKVKEQNSFQSYIDMFSQSISVRKFSELKPQTHFRKNSKFKKNTIVISELAPTVEFINVNHPFFMKNIVFTGELSLLERKEAMQKVVNVGGIIKSAVSSKTHFLVVGKQDKLLVGEDGLSTKEEKAYALIEKGIEINIINESELMRLLAYKKDKAPLN